MTSSFALHTSAYPAVDTARSGRARNKPKVGVKLEGAHTAFVNFGSINVSNKNTGSRAREPAASARRPDFSIPVGLFSLVRRRPRHGALGVYSGTGFQSMAITNYGSITAHRTKGSTSTSTVAGVQASAKTTSLVVTNQAHATIRASGANSFAVGGRAENFALMNDGKIANRGGKAAIFISGSGTSTIDNSRTGRIKGDVYLMDGPSTSGTAKPAGPGTRDTTFTNEGVIKGTMHYGEGKQDLTNRGRIAGDILVDQTGSLPISQASPSFSLMNKGVLAGNITIDDQSSSMNSITLIGHGFSGALTAETGTGSNSLVLHGATRLASVQNFSSLELNRSHVTVAQGISLVNGANLQTIVHGPGGTFAAPSQTLGTINGTLNLGGRLNVAPIFTTFVRDGDVFQVASTVAGGGAVTVTQPPSILVQAKAEASDGRLLLVTQVRDARSVSGIAAPAAATINGLTAYTGPNAQVLAFGTLVEGFTTQTAVRAAATALTPTTNGADVQTPINASLMFNQQIDSRLDSFLYAQIPSSGRSADLGVSQPDPIYGALPASGAWMEGIGGGVTQDTSGGASGYNATLAGAVGGYDRSIAPGVRIGGAFGYIDGRIADTTNAATREDIQTYQGLAYISYDRSSYYLRGLVGFGGVDFAGTRQVAFDGFSDIAINTHSGTLFTTHGEIGRPYELAGSLLVPYAAFTFSNLMQNGYAETSANMAGLSYLATNNSSSRSEVGAKMVLPLDSALLFRRVLPSGAVMAFEGRAAYVREFGDVSQTVAASFTGSGNAFVVPGASPARDMIDYGAGLRLGAGRWQLDLSYNGLAGSGYLQQVGLLRVRCMF